VSEAESVSAEARGADGSRTRCTASITPLPGGEERRPGFGVVLTGLENRGQTPISSVGTTTRSTRA
jgi:hypothetical protein